MPDNVEAPEPQAKTPKAAAPVTTTDVPGHVLVKSETWPDGILVPKPPEGKE